jgi:uncharacterized surface protein with fasciclin (FAS1) repeats
MLLTITVGLIAAACAPAATPTPTAVPPTEAAATAVPTAAPASDDIVDTAIADGRFTTLVAAVQAAGLEETLRGEGPFTVFAPTDEAFAALPEGTVESLLLPENQQQLADILLYHVVAGEVRAEQVVTLESADTVGGQSVTIRVEEGRVFINDSEVIITDIPASNGVIHVIDAVLLPPTAADGH